MEVADRATLGEECVNSVLLQCCRFENTPISRNQRGKWRKYANQLLLCTRGSK